MLLDNDLLKDAVTKLFTDDGRKPCEEERLAACSAVHYAALRLEQEKKFDQASELRMILSSEGYIPQGVNRNYVMNLNSIRLSPTGELCSDSVSSGSESGRAVTYIIASRSMKPLLMLPSHEGTSFASGLFAPDSVHYAMFSRSRLTVWNLSEIRIEYDVEFAHDENHTVSWSGDSRFIAFSEEGEISLVEISDGKGTRVGGFSTGSGSIRCMALNEDGSVMMFAKDIGASVLDMSSGEIRDSGRVQGSVCSIDWTDAGFIILTDKWFYKADASGYMSFYYELEDDVTGSSIGMFYRDTSFYTNNLRQCRAEQIDGDFYYLLPDATGTRRIQIHPEYRIIDSHMDDIMPTPDRTRRLAIENIRSSYPYSGLHDDAKRICKRIGGCIYCSELRNKGLGYAELDCFRIILPESAYEDADFIISDACSSRFFDMRPDTEPDLYIYLEDTDYEECYRFGTEGYDYVLYRVYGDAELDIYPYSGYDCEDYGELVDGLDWFRFASSDETYCAVDTDGPSPSVYYFDGDFVRTELPSGTDILCVCSEGVFVTDGTQVYSVDVHGSGMKELFPLSAVSEQLENRSVHISCIRQYDDAALVILNSGSNMCEAGRVEPGSKYRRIGFTSVYNGAFMDRSLLITMTDSSIKFTYYDSGKVWRSYDIRNDLKWAVDGVSKDGTVSMIKRVGTSDSNISPDADLEFGMMRPPYYHPERFKNASKHIDQRFLFGNGTFSMRKNDTVFLESDRDGQSLTYARLGSEGLGRIRRIVPDSDRNNVGVFALGDGKYIVCSNDRQQGEPQSRIFIRLMDSATGQPVSYGLKGTEGQMFGEKGYAIREGCRSVLIGGGRYLAVESEKNGHHIVNTWNIETGKRYPVDGGRISGRILDSEGETITIGLEESDLSIVSQIVTDCQMNIISRRDLNVRMISDRSVMYDGCISRIPYIDDDGNHGYCGLPYNFTFRWKDRANEDVHVLIPLGEAEPLDEEPEYPQPYRLFSFMEDMAWYRQKVSIGTLRNGVVVRGPETELTFVLNSDSFEHDIADAAADSFSVYTIAGHTVIGQIMRREGEMFDPQYTMSFTDLDTGKGINGIICNWSSGMSYDGPFRVSEDGVSYIRLGDDGRMHHEDTAGRSFPLDLSRADYNPCPIHIDDRMSVTSVSDYIIMATDGERTECKETNLIDLSKVVPNENGCDVMLNHDGRYHIACTHDLQFGNIMTSAPPSDGGSSMYDVGDSIITECHGLFIAERK